MSTNAMLYVLKNVLQDAGWLAKRYKPLVYRRPATGRHVYEAKSQLSHLLQLVEEGETVVIAHNGEPVAELVPARRKGGFPFGIAHQEPLVAAGDEWWQPMHDREAEDWIDGQ